MMENFLDFSNIEDEPEFMPIFSLEDEDEVKLKEDYPSVLPVLPLKNTILFPGVVIPITVGREKSIRAVQKAYDGSKMIAVLGQIDSKVEDPVKEDLFSIGTIAKVLRLLKMPDGTTTAFLQGRRRFELVEMISETPFMQGEIRLLGYNEPENKMEFEALVSSIRDKAKGIIELSPNIPTEAAIMLKNINNNPFLLNFIASNLNNIKLPARQRILELHDLTEKAKLVLQHIDADLQVLELKGQIESKVRNDIEKQQRDYFLNQQMKAIQEELGQNPQEEEINILHKRSLTKKWSKEVADHFNKELNKVRRMNSQAAEFSMLMNYLEVLLDLPWNEYTKDDFDLKKVLKVLDKDHFGLEDVKNRILEHLAVLKLKGDMKAPILCLVGPPGVGKTSLGKSIATALKRKFVRMSLGGLHDESEIRGHRKTYIGAMPGRIVQSLRKVGSGNPVFILDEIDKVGKDFRGDPSSALLEVLDPEQNATFYDNYLELEYDLSKVLFIATANSLSSIQPALLDRMEIIEVSGYSTEEKVEIAKRHLIPDQRKEHGLKPKDVNLRPDAIQKIIEEYTRESGVRNLDRQIASVMRNTAKKVAMKEDYPQTVVPSDIKPILGPPRFSKDLYESTDVNGVAVGLAWTSVGGDILFIEASTSKGRGKLTLTGNLGDVMKESATTALSFLRANSQIIGIEPDTFDQFDIHIHVPEGAIPKDGPSAGITMMTALASAFTHIPVKPYLAMTGEITLRGKVLPVGGIKEKILAAKRAGMKYVILCKENQKNVEQIPAAYLTGMQFHYVERMEEVLDIAIRYEKGGENSNSNSKAKANSKTKAKIKVL
jgi:ATP-dependent Lon protease